MGRVVTPLLRVTARVCYSCIEQQQYQHNRSNSSINSSSVHGGSSSGSEDAALALEALTEALKLLLCALGARGRLTAAQGHKEFLGLGMQACRIQAALDARMFKLLSCRKFVATHSASNF
eukprot:17499-Heterococcus_DN1.PRE.2